MSFCNNCKSDKIPGPIRSNPMCGICEKACIQCDKVLDMCMRQEVLENIQITVTDITPTTLVAPYTFISAKTIGDPVTISNLVVTDIGEIGGLSRVSGNVNIPVQVLFTDANNNQGTGTAIITVPKDVVLNTASPSVMPYEIDASAAIISTRGTYVGNNVFTITACSTVILKVLIEVQLLVPSYGYCCIPQCKEYTEDECAGVFDIPLYPQECGVDGRNRNVTT